MYLISDPFIANSSIPKEIFYSYIDDEMVNINGEIHCDLLKKSHEVLSAGMIAAQEDAQYTRPVQGELGHEHNHIAEILQYYCILSGYIVLLLQIIRIWGCND